MGELFKSKVRNIGTSVGILIPKEIVIADKIKVGDEVEVNITKKMTKEEREKMVDELFGIAKRMGRRKKLLQFERDRIDRVERWLK